MSFRPRYYRPRSERAHITTLRPNQRDFQAYNARITNAEVDNEVLTLTFDRAVLLRSGVRPTGIQTDVGEPEVSAAQPSRTQIAITYADTVAAATEVLLPNATNRIRTSDGGYIVSPTFPVPGG